MLIMNNFKNKLQYNEKNIYCEKFNKFKINHIKY